MRVLRVEGASKNVAVAEKRIEALLASLDNHRITLPRPGVPLLDFDCAAFGVNAVGLQIHNHDDTIQNNPELVRRFVKATMRAFETAMANPAASIRAGQKATSDLETDLSLEQLKVGIALMPSKASHGRPVGYMAPEDFRRLVEVNLTRSFIVTRATAVAMLARPHDGRAGQIVLMGSIQGKEGMALGSACFAAKADVMALAKSMAKDWTSSTTGITASTCRSGWACRVSGAADATCEAMARGRRSSISTKWTASRRSWARTTSNDSTRRPRGRSARYSISAP